MSSSPTVLAGGQFALLGRSGLGVTESAPRELLLHNQVTAAADAAAQDWRQPGHWTLHAIVLADGPGDFTRHRPPEYVEQDFFPGIGPARAPSRAARTGPRPHYRRSRDRGRASGRGPGRTGRGPVNAAHEWHDAAQHLVRDHRGDPGEILRYAPNLGELVAGHVALTATGSRQHDGWPGGKAAALGAVQRRGHRGRR